MKQREEQSGLILLVEDNRGISEMVGEFLERRGYSVDYAADGVTGLHLAVTNSYDVIVLDLMLPGMDGLEVCRKLRADAKKSTPVLMLTARDTLEDKLVGLDAGADDYLVKPFEIRELEARVKALDPPRPPPGQCRTAQRRRSGARHREPAPDPRRPGTAGLADRPASADDPDARIAARGQPARHRARSLGRPAAGFGYAAQPFV